MAQEIYKTENMTILQADSMGFCGGVKVGLKKLWESIEKYDGIKIFLLDEMIHNPKVNSDIKEAGVIYISEKKGEDSEVKAIRKYITNDDVAVPPAFGAALESIEAIRQVGGIMVDTTCPSVTLTHKDILKYNKAGYTTLYYGKPGHQEAVAALSRADKYLLITGEEDVQMLNLLYKNIKNGEELLNHFRDRCSNNLQPQKDLNKIGLVAQTTLLKDKVISLFDKLESVGKENGLDVIRTRDVCSATQANQKAVDDLCKEKPDIIIAIGGYNSSNTGNLAKAAKLQGIKCVYHVEGYHEKITEDSIKHQPIGTKEEVVTNEWLIKPAKIAITAGASTPDEVTKSIIEKIKSFDS